jgi:sterol desaturase/sphingolipid hydroxylase (fatty acid hydroxylase superfamily)
MPLPFSILDALRAFAVFAIGSLLLVEFIGYFWHRFAEHDGKLGKLIQRKHWVHHEEDYPVTNLRPPERTTYKDAKSWTWYVLAAVVTAIIFLVLQLREAIPLAAGSLLYAQCVVSYFHSVFHLEKHWLHRFGWFRRLTKLHDIHHWVPGNFGIVFFGMDRIFGTMIPEFPKPLVKKTVFPGL